MKCVPEDDLRANIQTVNIKTRTATKVHMTQYTTVFITLTVYNMHYNFKYKVTESLSKDNN